jgi:hypothetical protein
LSSQVSHRPAKHLKELTFIIIGNHTHHASVLLSNMSDTSDGPRSALLDRLNHEATVSASTADNYSIRAWLTSAKKCLDQVRLSDEIALLPASC